MHTHMYTEIFIYAQAHICVCVNIYIYENIIRKK